MSTNEALASLRVWRYDPVESRLHPRELLLWARGEVGGERQDADAVVQLQVIDLLAGAVHQHAWILRYACSLVWPTCPRCSGRGHVPLATVAEPLPVDTPCALCDGVQVVLAEHLTPIVSQCPGWERAHRDRGRRFIWHGLDYELQWVVGESATIIGEPPTTALGVWYRRALDECRKNGFLLAVDLTCSADASCRRIGERLLGRRCERCDGTGRGYFPLDLQRTRNAPDAWRVSNCPDCKGSGSIVQWWRR